MPNKKKSLHPKARTSKKSRKKSKTSTAPSSQASNQIHEASRHYTAGEYFSSMQCCMHILAQNPDDVDALHLLALNEHELGHYDKAIESFERARELAPDFPLVHYNLGNSYRMKYQMEEAEACYRQSLLLSPGLINAYVNLGVVLMKRGKFKDAEDILKQALSQDPNQAEVINNLGTIYLRAGRFEEAMLEFEKAMKIKDSYEDAFINLGTVYLSLGRIDDALRCLVLLNKIKLDHRTPPSGKLRLELFRIKHDLEQVRLLEQRGKLAAEFKGYAKNLEQLWEKYKKHSVKNPAEEVVFLEGEDLQKFAPSLNRLVYFAQGSNVPVAINPKIDVNEIERRYHGTKPEVVYIDNFLTPEALKELQNFCWESTIWRTNYQNGYIGTFLGAGFSAPIILQISEELRKKFPGIFEEHRLTQAWGFKYDSTRKGINIHADFAAVNVNFWITPDTANLKPGTGGLIIWDKESPADWEFVDYNQNEPKIRDFLRKSGAKPINVPFKENRAVIFNSTLFHETDQFSFKDEYLSRRINVTFLYGQGLREK